MREEQDKEGMDVGEEGSKETEEESEEDSSSGSGGDKGEEEDEEMQRAGVLAGVVEPTEKIWKMQAANALRQIAKGMCIAAQGYDRLATKVDKTPLEALAPWVKHNITGIGRAPITKQPRGEPPKHK